MPRSLWLPKPCFSRVENIYLLQKHHIIYINVNKLYLSCNLDKESLGQSLNKRQKYFPLSNVSLKIPKVFIEQPSRSYFGLDSITIFSWIFNICFPNSQYSNLCLLCRKLRSVKYLKFIFKKWEINAINTKDFKGNLPLK